MQYCPAAARWTHEHHIGTDESLFCAGLPERRGDPLERLLDVLAAVEGADPDVALAALAEPDAGRADDLGLLEEEVEERP
jgi:hypothetical protein